MYNYLLDPAQRVVKYFVPFLRAKKECRKISCKNSDKVNKTAYVKVRLVMKKLLV